MFTVCRPIGRASGDTYFAGARLAPCASMGSVKLIKCVKMFRRRNIRMSVPTIPRETGESEGERGRDVKSRDIRAWATSHACRVSRLERVLFENNNPEISFR